MIQLQGNSGLPLTFNSMFQSFLKYNFNLVTNYLVLPQPNQEGLGQHQWGHCRTNKHGQHGGGQPGHGWGWGEHCGPCRPHLRRGGWCWPHRAWGGGRQSQGQDSSCCQALEGIKMLQPFLPLVALPPPPLWMPKIKNYCQKCFSNSHKTVLCPQRHVTCARCLRKGHWARHCPFPIICNYCHQLNHLDLEAHLSEITEFVRSQAGVEPMFTALSGAELHLRVQLTVGH